MNGLIYCIVQYIQVLVHLPTDSVFGLTEEHVYIPFSCGGALSSISHTITSGFAA